VPSGLSLLRASRHIETLLGAGFTTVRDCGGLYALNLRRAVREGVIPGPRIVAAGHVLTQTFGHGDDHYLPSPDPGCVAPHDWAILPLPGPSTQEASLDPSPRGCKRRSNNPSLRRPDCPVAPEQKSVSR